MCGELPPHPATIAANAVARTIIRFTAGQCTGCLRRGSYVPRRARSRPASRELCAPGRPGRPEPPARADPRDQRLDRARAVRPRDHRARRTPPERKYVDVLYSDQHVRRAHIELAGEKLLGYSPPWLVTRLRELGEVGGALCAITGNPEPELFADLDGARVGRARMHAVNEESLKLTDGLCNWTIVAYPNEGWARTVLRRARRRAAVGSGRTGSSSRPARSRGCVAGAHRPAAESAPQR